MTDYTSLNLVWNQINPADRIVIFGHRNPDGDALGSTLALQEICLQKQLEVTVIYPDPYPDSFSWMAGVDKVLDYESKPTEVKEKVENADWLFFLDFNTPSRLGQLSEEVHFNLQKAVIIDHHPEPNQEVEYVYSDTSQSSTCEWLYHLLCESNHKSFINSDVANCIFTGMITDTGGFNHNASSAPFFRTIADLIELGADKDAIYQRVFHTQNESRFRLLGKILNKNIDLNYELGVAIMWLEASDLAANHFQKGDTEGFVNMPLSLEGINISILVTEMEDEVKLSFRSRSGYTINEFAATYFNGGGHKNAAGGRSTEGFEATMKKLNEKLPLL